MQQLQQYRNISLIESSTHMLDEFADDCVVEIVYVLPLDSLQHVLFLLRLEGQLDEHLLQLLVAIVDDELLKTVAILKYLKAVDI